jgi:alanine racemase
MLLHGELAEDWVRPGIMLYGGTPGVDTAAGFGLQPAMTLSSRLIAVQEIAPATRSAMAAASWPSADAHRRGGLRLCGRLSAPRAGRHAGSGRRRALLAGGPGVDGHADRRPDPRRGAQVGAVTLWGDGLPIDEVAHAAGTIGYELMCAVAQRVVSRSAVDN